jgi:Tyrosine-protein kinase ephrin type A/B receptor-like
MLEPCRTQPQVATRIAQFGATGSVRCNARPAGKFHNQSAVGSFTNASRCRKCEPGKYQGSAGQAVCLPCAVGMEATVHGTVACEPCPKNTFTNSSLQVSCIPCLPGSVTSSTSSVDCTDCPPGEFDNATRGVTACSHCETGSFVNVIGAVSCQLCPRGQHQPAKKWYILSQMPSWYIPARSCTWGRCASQGRPFTSDHWLIIWCSSFAECVLGQSYCWSIFIHGYCSSCDHRQTCTLHLECRFTDTRKWLLKPIYGDTEYLATGTVDSRCRVSSICIAVSCLPAVFI